MQLGKVEPSPSDGYRALVKSRDGWDEISDNSTLNEAKWDVEYELGAQGSWEKKGNSWEYVVPVKNNTIYVRDPNHVSDRLVDVAAISGITLIGVAATKALL